MTTPAEPIVRTRGLDKHFGEVRALDGIDLEIVSGVTGVVGANGAGKSTLFKLMLGLIEPTAGSITTLGLHPVRDGRELRTLVGYSPERNVLPDTMAADEFVRHLAEVRGLPRSEARSRASDTLWLVGLAEERFRPLGSMSTGQRQRVKLAQALAADPALILLDEPTEGLDPMQREQMLDLIREVRSQFGIDVVVTSHVLDEVERVCDHVVVLDGGVLMMAGPLEEIAGTGAGVVLELVATPHQPDPAGTVAARLSGNPLVAGVDLAGQVLSVRGAEDAAHDDLLDACRDAVATGDARLRRIGGRRVSLEEVIVAGATHPGSGSGHGSWSNPRGVGSER